jgi:hypothetical protein
MTKLRKWAKEGFRLAGLGLFELLILFWVAKLFYCVRGYFVAGIPGMMAALMHGTPIPADPTDWGHLRWGILALKLVVIALVTVTMGVLNRSTLAMFWHDFGHRPAKRHQSN